MTDLQSIFERILDPGASTATAPMLALGVGMVLYLASDVVAALRPARPLVFVGSIAVALFFELRMLLSDTVPGVVLDGTLVADHTTALFGCIFLVGTLLAWAYSVGYYREAAAFKGEHDALMLAAPVGMMMMVGSIFFCAIRFDFNRLLSITWECCGQRAPANKDQYKS